MRSSIFVSILLAAVAVIASPLKARDDNVDIEWVTVTADFTSTIYVTAGAAEVPSTSTVTTTQGQHRHHHWSPQSSQPVSTQAPVPASSISTPAPAPVSSAAASSIAPAPVSSPAASSAVQPVATTPASVQQSATSAAATAAQSGASDFINQVLAQHNNHRQNNSVPALVWNDTLAASSQDLANTCVYEHNITMDGGGYGQNIAAGTPAATVGAVITNIFYNNEMPLYADLYGQANPDMTNFEKWGHFSQMVWKSTTSVGCATVKCNALVNTDAGSVRPDFTVCNYFPPGNYAGEYADNVFPPTGMPYVHLDG